MSSCVVRCLAKTIFAALVFERDKVGVRRIRMVVTQVRVARLSVGALPENGAIARACCLVWVGVVVLMYLW